jgi:hypothetical protein
MRGDLALASRGVALEVVLVVSSASATLATGEKTRSERVMNTKPTAAVLLCFCVIILGQG